MSKTKILIQLDSDPRASVFDAVVAIDSGIDHLLQYHNVQPTDVRELIHGAMFTRGPQDLHQTAVFIGGSNVAAGELLLKAVTDCFFGPLRVSVLLDANGANTTSAAAVLTAARHLDLANARALVLAGTGPVGQRVARLLARNGAAVRLASRSLDRAEEVCRTLRASCPNTKIAAVQCDSQAETRQALEGIDLVIAAGAAGVELLHESVRRGCSDLKVAIDLNAVPPAGIAGMEATDKARQRDGVIAYGAIGVGGTKMRIHKAAIAQLYESNDRVLDADEVFDIGRELES
jgi:hypothetical protein